MRRVALVGVLLLVVGMAAGCTAQPDLVPELSEAAGSQDELPGALGELDGTEVDAATVRYAGEGEGWRAYIARSEASGYCLVVFSGGEEKQGACADALPVEVEVHDGPSFWFTGDTGTEPDGYEQLSPSVYWKPAD